MTEGAYPRSGALLVLLVLLASPLLGATTSGHLEATGFSFFTAASADDPYAVGWGTAFVEHKRRLGAARLVGSVRVEGITSRARGPLELDLADRELRRTPVSVRELYVRVPLGRGVDLQAGRFQLGWGRTDGYSPADAFLPRDLSDPFADDKLPVWGVRLDGQRGRYRAELVATATTTPWRLPLLGGRYAPVDVPGLVLTDGANDPPMTGLFAGKLQRRGDVWDVGGSIRGGVRPAPLLVFRQADARPTADGGFTVPVDRRYVHEEGVGLELSRIAGDYILRLEAAVLQSRDPELGRAVPVAFGLERAFGEGRVLVTLATNLRDTPVDPALLFDRALLPAAIVAWTRTEDWGRWRLVWTTGLEEGDGLVEAEAVVTLTDHWSYQLGTDVPYGPRTGPLGALGDARRVRSTVRFDW